jgi:hypothetical protein
VKNPHCFDKLNTPPALSQRERGKVSQLKTVQIGVRKRQFRFGKLRFMIFYVEKQDSRAVWYPN